jgi:glycosyltransferase involved in cell wall biosynthesis
VTAPVNSRIRLTAVLTHPIQYYAPWFRYVATHCPEIDLTVLYATRPTPAQQGVGFGAAFEWDAPMTEGYRSLVLRAASAENSVHSDRFWGLDVPEIGPAIRQTQPDVVLIPGWHSVTLLRALWACRWARLPVLYRGDTHLGNAPSGSRRPGWLLRTRLLLKMFDGYLSVGERTRAYLLRFGVREARIFHAPHCVDNAFFAGSAAPHQTATGRAAARESMGLEARDFVALFVGKLEPKKRPMDLVRAVARMKPGARLLIVGAGELESACRAEANALGVRVSWAGFLNQSELGRAYAAADCLVLPSGWGDTWGLVVNEAMATGLPCVVSDRVGCAPDLVAPGETGEVFPMGDEAALTSALERVRERCRIGHDWAVASRQRMTRYSFEDATSGLLIACRAVTGRQPRSYGGAIGTSSQVRVVTCCGAMVIVFGLERMTFEVLRVLRERGAAVHCIVNSWENHRIVALATQIGATWSTGYYWYSFDRHTRNALRWAQLAWDILWTSVGLLRDTWRVRATHILVPEFSSVLRNAPALALLRLLGFRVILRLGNAPEAGPFYRKIWRWAINPVVDHIVCNSQFTQMQLLAHGVPKEKTSLIYNCVPRRSAPERGDVPRDLRKLIYVGQIIPEKGVDLLLEAVSILVARGYDVHLDVAGQMDGWVAPAHEGYRERLILRAGEPDLSGRVRFLGLREDVPALLAGAAIHCCPSRPEQREGFGVVTIEAKRAGIPSVVFPSGALPELVAHEEDGWVCAEVSARALAEGIEYFLKDPLHLERASTAAKRSVERFSQHDFAEAWWNVFRAR